LLFDEEASVSDSEAQHILDTIRRDVTEDPCPECHDESTRWLLAERDALAAQLAAAREALEKADRFLADQYWESDISVSRARDVDRIVSLVLLNPSAAAEALLERVRKEERERCAKVAEEVDCEADLSSKVAAAIRALK
jgi:hypothetical protein